MTPRHASLSVSAPQAIRRPPHRPRRLLSGSGAEVRVFFLGAFLLLGVATWGAFGFSGATFSSAGHDAVRTPSPVPAGLLHQIDRRLEELGRERRHLDFELLEARSRLDARIADWEEIIRSRSARLRRSDTATPTRAGRAESMLLLAEIGLHALARDAGRECGIDLLAEGGPEGRVAELETRRAEVAARIEELWALREQLAP